MDEYKELTTLEEIKAFSVPYRIKILETMYGFKTPVTVKNIAVKMGETPSKIHYHIKIMEEVGIVQLIYNKSINGIIAKFYEPTAEHYLINHTSGKDEDKVEMLNETQKVIATYYDESKKIFLNQLAKTNEKHAGFAMPDEIYLTAEEFPEYQRELENITKKYSTNSNKDGKIKYKTFYTIIGME